MERIGNLWDRWAALSLRRPGLIALIGFVAFALCIPVSADLGIGHREDRT